MEKVKVNPVPATNPEEIEITPAMVAAGALVLKSSYSVDELIRMGNAAEVAERVISAALRPSSPEKPIAA